MRIFRYLFSRKTAVAVVPILLIVKAVCDLALPTFTSDIVDIGIQQSGVERVTCEEMTDSTYSKVEPMLSDSDREVFAASYDEHDGVWRLNDEGRNNIDQLDAMLARPLIEVHSGSENSSDLASDSLVRQRAISATIAEYEASGYDLTGMRNSYLLRVGLVMLLIAAFGMIVEIFISFVAARTGAFIGRDLRSRLFSRVVSFSEREINHFSAASLITRGTNDIQLIQNVSIMLLRMVLYAPILAIGGIVMVMLTNAQLGWIVVVSICAVFLVIGVLFGLTLPRFKIMQKLIDRVNLVAREALSGMSVVRAFDREDYEEGRFDKASERLMRTQLFTNRAMAFMMPTMMLIMNCTSVAIVWFGGLGVQDGSIQTGDLIAFITYAMVIIMGFLMIGMMAIMLPRANVAAQRVDEVIAYEPSIHDPETARKFAGKDASATSDSDDDLNLGYSASASGEADTVPACELLNPKGARIEFDDVSFCYDADGGCEDVLSHISFTAEPGQTVAIIGATGSGKSTVLKLIERFYDVTDGSIRIDGEDVRSLPQAYLRSQLGYVPQKAFLFSGTVATNVAYANKDMPSEQIRDALAVSQALAFVEDMEDGINAEISQGGTNVSGGQRQRLAIARAIATGARALLFDDSFSALDYKTDAALRHALKECVDGATCIVVAQRISTVMDADLIIVLEDGKAVGCGTHSELLENCPAYREIAASQLSEAELATGGQLHE